MKSNTKRLTIVLLIVVLSWMGIGLMNHYSQPATQLGVHNGRLADCPDRPNCVCSQSDDPQHYLRPIAYTGSPEQVKQDLKKILTEMPNATIVQEDADYLRAEFRSRILRFVDDAEFLIDKKNQQIHFRSASRIGFSDLGVNRNRIESIRENIQ